MPQNPIYVVFSKTATDDLAFKLVTMDTWLKEVDIFVYTNDAYIGNFENQTLWVAANDVYTIKGIVNLNDIFIKNYGAGNNTVISLAGVALSDYEKRQNGIG
jgi:hypothetical protein